MNMYIKCASVIKSCETLEQLTCAGRYVKNANRMRLLSGWDCWELQKEIGRRGQLWRLRAVDHLATAITKQPPGSVMAPSTKA